MKKLSLIILLFTATIASAQFMEFSLKGGANFSNIDGKIGSTELETKISYHIGAAFEFRIANGLSFQPEVIYSIQGANIDSSHSLDEIDLKYINIPVLLKLYLFSSKMSIEAGPQFSYLTDHNLKNMLETEDYDFSLAGGITFYVTNSLFIQGRYISGINEFAKNADVKNKNIQLSLGISF